MLNPKVVIKLDAFITEKIGELAEYMATDAVIEFDDSLVGDGRDFAISEEDLGELDQIFVRASEKLMECAEQFTTEGA